jgi:uncharacterized protein
MSTSMLRTRVTTIFTKKPEPGAVKTRLCPPLSPREAAELASAMLADTVAKCVASRAFATIACVAPPSVQGSEPRDFALSSTLDWFRAQFPAVARLAVQHGEGLGARLANHFEEELSRAAASLVCIGGDAPHAPIERCEEAHALLETGADLVLGPDDGGGYYLVGLKAPVRALFTDVAMSTGDMCERTAHLARSLGLRVAFVARDYDIDLPRDLARLHRELESGRISAERLPRTAAWIARYFGFNAPASRA